MRGGSIGLARWLLGLACLAGCSRQTKSIDRYIPQSAVAHDALDAALSAWQQGEPVGAVRGTAPVVQVVDTHRRPVQRLERYEILGEVGGDSGRCFSVRLTFDNPSQEEKARFVVIGLDPLWVFREEDYTMLLHWEMPMPSHADSDKDSDDAAGKEES